MVGQREACAGSQCCGRYGGDRLRGRRAQEVLARTWAAVIGEEQHVGGVEMSRDARPKRKPADSRPAGGIVTHGIAFIGLGTIARRMASYMGRHARVRPRVAWDPNPAQIEAFRKMTPQERWKITADLMELAWRALVRLTPEERERRLAVARRHHDLSNEAIAAALK